jgi:two-component system NtrC family response regulator
MTTKPKKYTGPERKILLIEDDTSLRRVTEYSLHSAGFQVLSAADAEQGLKSFQVDFPPVVITDINMPGLSGYDVLERIKSERPETLVIVITAYGTLEKAVEAMRKGAYDYLVKPVSKDELALVVEKAFNLLGLQKENQRLKSEIEHRTDFNHIIGNSEEMKSVFDVVSKVAPSEASVLITGESGTGKELIAHAIHQGSQRSDNPFVAINCAAIPENLLESELFGHVRGAFTGASKDRDGKFVEADGGTLFLDEIGEMPMGLQPKLLRALQEMQIEPVGGKTRSVDVRILAATNQDVETSIEEGLFREDLYYRLSVIPIDLPPLRHRKEDIPLLLKFFLKRNDAVSLQFSEEAMSHFISYHWPGNVRELQNVIERLVILHPKEVIESQHLPPKLLQKQLLHKNQIINLPREGYSLEDLEKEAVVQALDRNGWNKTRAADFLKIPRHSINYRIEKYGIKNR